MLTRLATIVAALAWPLAAPAQPVAPAPPPTMLADPLESPAEGLAADAAQYAAAYGVPPAEAVRRLEAQEASVPLVQRLVAGYADRLAGVVIEHRPSYRIVLNVTDAGTGAASGEVVVATAPLGVPVVVRSGARGTRQATLAAIAAHQAELRAAMPNPPGMGVDPHTGALLVLTRPGDLDGDGDRVATAARLEAIAGVPVEVRTWGDVGTDATAETAQAIETQASEIVSMAPPVARVPVGGGRVVGGDAEESRRFLCTSGFVVTDGARTALSTAAHCPDHLAFVDRDGRRVPLALIGAWGAATQDVQLHDAGEALSPLFHGDTLDRDRSVATWRPRAATRAGDFVCHQGQRSGYACAEVAFPDFAPPGDLCAGNCPATWVAVRGPKCRGGDSGGPVFVGSVAFGLVKGNSTDRGTCALYYYMSVDYLPPGWTVAYGRPAALPRPEAGLTGP